MGKTEKLLSKLAECNGPFSFRDMCTLLGRLGYEMSTKGKSSGSRVSFYNREFDHLILTHRPHPGDEMINGAVEEIKDRLTEVGILKE
nr:type II toxin-antitoxin system HicA family toxin [uncultured Cohaesibacter sp.]